MIDAAVKTGAEMQVVEGEVRDLARVQLDFMRKTGERFAEVQTQIDGMVGSLRTIAGETETNSKDIAYLQGYLYSKMSPEERLAALESGTFGKNQSEKERQAEQKRLECEVKRRQVINSVGKYIDGANQIVNIARNVGVELPNEVGQAVNIAQVGFAAFTSFSTNPLGAIAMVTGVFGRQTDVAAQRHGQIVGMLNEIRQDIADVKATVDAIDEELDLVRKGQSQIIQNQQVIHQAIFDLAADIDNKHRDVLCELEFIGGEVYSARLALGSLLNKDFYQCHKATELLRERGVDSPLALGWTELRAWLASDAGSQAATCLQGLEQNITSPTLILEKGGSHFAMRLNPAWQDDDGHRAQDWINRVYRPLSALIRDNGEFGAFKIGGEARLAALASPVGTVHDLETKLNDLAAAEQPLPERLQRVLGGRSPVPDKKATSTQHTASLLPEQQVAQLLKEPLAPELIVATVDHLLRFHPLWEVGNRVGNRVHLLAPDKLLAGKGKDTFGRSQLYYALATTDLAIGQQNLLSGDLLLPWFYAKLLEIPNIAGLLVDVRDEKGKVVHSLEALRRNLVTYILTKERRADRWTAIGYAFALTGKNKAGLNYLFGERFNFEHVNGSWCLKLPAPTRMEPMCVPLPTAAVLDRQRLPVSPIVLELLSLRDRLVEAIAEFDVAEAGYDHAHLVHAATLLQVTTSQLK